MPREYETGDPSGSSFRDPAGYVFKEDGLYKRVVCQKGKTDYNLLMESGLYDRLAEQGLLIKHREEQPSNDVRQAWKVLVPEQISYISYPYEWSFGQLKDAALLTLRIQRTALGFGMTLKDASAFNVQFRGSRPVFIDTLSFEKDRGGAWKAYGQFCRHFLAPLAVLSRVSLYFQPFWKMSLDGLPLDLASSILPRTSYFNWGCLFHIHLHSRFQKRYSDPRRAAPATKGGGVDPKAAVADSLISAIKGCRTPRDKTEWADYYQEAQHYSDAADREKKDAVEAILARTSPKVVLDLGGNIGTYSRLATSRGINCVCCDVDPQCVHQNYESAKKRGDHRMLPLVMDLTNPSPPLGFESSERLGFLERPEADLVLALALIHHLRIGGNLPLRRLAAFMARLGGALLIEFVPKEDQMVQTLLRSRDDIFDDYDFETFKATFGEYFELDQVFQLPTTSRRLCFFRRRT